jgi:hypothetical protein
VSVSPATAPAIHQNAAGEVVELTPDSSTVFEAENQNKRLCFWVQRFEGLTVMLVALLAATLHAGFVTHVGGLWRDETNSINLATLPSLGEVWHFLDYDSFPILFFAVLRVWAGIFGAANDAALRGLGLITGLGLLWALWTNARSLGVHWPVLSLALVGLNPMVIRYGDSTRAYGLGILLILLTFRGFWRLVDSPSPLPKRRVLAATALALLSVQCLYYNSVLLLAIAAAAIAVALRARMWCRIVIVLSIGILAAVSLLPYLPVLDRMHEWTFLVSYPVDLAWLWKRVCDVIGSPFPLAVWLWLSAFFVGLGAVAGVETARFLGLSALRRNRKDLAKPSIAPKTVITPQQIPSAVLFAAVALTVGVAAYAGFLQALNYVTQPWYYITLAAFAACTLDVVFGAWPAVATFYLLALLLRGLRIAIALLLLCLGGLPAWKEMPVRHTNLDLLAARLRPLATKDDLIVVPVWECAITLCRYYRGPAEVVSLPPIEDHRFHRYDLALRQMMTANPLDPIFARMEEVLRSGHRVFVAGSLLFTPMNKAPPNLPQAYCDASGLWHLGPYRTVWQLQCGHFLRAHAMGVGRIEVPVPNHCRVQEYENEQLIMFQGWRRNP